MFFYKKVVVVIMLLATDSFCLSQQQISKLDAMPAEIIGKIFGYLSDQVGTHGFVNKADIPIALKSIYRAGTVNKKINDKVNSSIATNLFIESLAGRFQITPLDIAVQIKTKSGYAWLRKYIYDSGEYELFKEIQRFFEISKDIYERVKPYGISIKGGQVELDRFDPSYCQTLQGLKLIVDKVPHQLCTPWGSVKLLEQVHCPAGMRAEIISQELFKQITATFECVSNGSCAKDNLVYYEQQKEIVLDLKTHQSFKDCFQEISKEALVRKKGQQALIVSSLCGASSLYNINSIDGKQLPLPEWMPRKNYRNYQVIKSLLKLMNNEFFGQSIEFEEGLTRLDCDEKKVKRSSQLYEVDHSIHITTIHEVAMQYTKLLNQVMEQDNLKGFLNRHLKFLPWEDLDDVRIVEILTRNANEFLPKENQWHCHRFGSENNRLYLNEELLGDGLALYMHQNNYPCNIEFLKNKYQEAIVRLQKGWSQARLINNQDILYTQSEEEWYLFCKRKDLMQEDILISLLSSKFTLNKKIRCYDRWHNDHNHKQELYLWVRKDSLDQVRSLLGFELIINEI